MRKYELLFKILFNLILVSKQQKFFSRKDALIFLTYRSSRPEVFCKKGVHTNFVTFTGKKPVLESLFNKVGTLLKKRLQHVFSHEFSEISNNTFFCRTLPVAVIKTFKTNTQYNHMLHENI